MPEFTVADLMDVVVALPTAPTADYAIAMTIRAEEGPRDQPWLLRYQDVMASDDYDEVLRLLELAESWHSDPAPPLLFDGQPAKLDDWNAPRPQVVSCGEYRMGRPSVRTIIDCETIDPSGGIRFTYAVLQRCLGLADDELMAMPQRVFAQLEVGVAFLARDFLTRTIAMRYSYS